MKRLIRSVRDFFRRELGITVLRRTIASFGSELARVIAEFQAAYAASEERHQRTLTEFQAAYASSEERHQRTLTEFHEAYAASEERQQLTLIEFQADYTASVARHHRTLTEFQAAYAAGEERHQRTLTEFLAAYAASEERHQRTLTEIQAAYAASEERHQRTLTEFQVAYAASEERHTEVRAAVHGFGAALDAVGGRQEARIAELFEAMKVQHAVLREAGEAAEQLASAIEQMHDARNAAQAHQISILALLLNGQHHADEAILEIRNLADAALIRRR